MVCHWRTHLIGIIEKFYVPRSMILQKAINHRKIISVYISIIHINDIRNEWRKTTFTQSLKGDIVRGDVAGNEHYEERLGAGLSVRRFVDKYWIRCATAGGSSIAFSLPNPSEAAIAKSAAGVTEAHAHRRAYLHARNRVPRCYLTTSPAWRRQNLSN